MNKLLSLRRHMLAHVEKLRVNPENLSIYVGSGQLIGGLETLDFQYQQNVRLVVLDYADHADTLALPLLAWLARFEPTLLSPKKQQESIHFETQILNNETVDVAFGFPLLETVKVSRDCHGNYTTVHANGDEACACCIDPFSIEIHPAANLSINPCPL